MKNLKYHLKETRYLIKQQKLGTVLMLLSMVIMLLFLTTVISAVYITGDLVEIIKSEAEIDVYTTGGDDLAIRTRIEAMGEGILATSISEEAAYEKMKTLLGEDENVLTYFDENPFEAYIEVKVPIDDASRLATQIQGLSGVEYVRDNRTVLEGVQTLSNTLTSGGVIVLIGVALGTFLIIAGVIRQSVYTYSEQIITMKLLGAPKRFIEVPFYLEGIILTLLSAFVAIGLHFIWYKVIYANAVTRIMMIQFPTDMSIFYGVSGLTIIFAGIVSVIGSYFGIKTSTL